MSEDQHRVATLLDWIFSSICLDFSWPVMKVDWSKATVHFFREDFDLLFATFTVSRRAFSFHSQKMCIYSTVVAML